MRNDIYSQAEPYTKKQRSRHRWIKITAFFACIVATATVYLLMIPTETLSGTAYCGQEEHTHTEDCYERVLACGYDDEDTQGHFHTKDCYVQEQVLLCEQEETPGHVHDESCVQREQNLICADTSEDHVHTDECYETVETYICGLTEGEGGHTHGPECYETEDVLVCELPEAHIHTDACYEMVLACEKEEHTHSLGCYADTTADVESEAVWERTVSDVELTGVWADDVVAIARSQLGYTESEKNYIVDENGKAKGYTRYGAWYGDAYGDWCAMFVSFCLSYADIPAEDMPREASCPRWVEKLDDLGMYLPAAYASGVGPGDVVFFDWDGDGWADHVGLVTEATESQITTIEGNSGDQVKENKYSLTDSSILGYGYLPENPEQPGEAEPETASLSAFTSFFSNDLSLGASNGISLAAAGDEGSQTLNDNAFITEVTIEHANQYQNDWEPVTEETKVKEDDKLKFEIKFEIPAGALNTDDDTVTYDLPSNIHINEDTSGSVMNGNTIIGEYTVTKDGKINITFNEATVSGNANSAIIGDVTVIVAVSNIDKTDDGTVVIPFNGETTSTIHVDVQPVKSEGDLTVKKDYNHTNFDDKTGLITYIITVSSTNGTGGPVTLSDVMTEVEYNGGTFTVTDNSGHVQNVTTPATGAKDFVLELPQMQAGETYIITYSAKMQDEHKLGEIVEKNYVKATSTSTTGKPIYDEATVETHVHHEVLQKTGELSGDGETITWTITINQSHQNIGGWRLDDVFNGARLDLNDAGGDLTIKKSDDETLATITSLPYTFPDNSSDTYTITYTTPADKAIGSAMAINTATLKPTDDFKEPTARSDVSVNVGGNPFQPLKKTSSDIEENADHSFTVQWNVTIDAAEGDIPAGWLYYDNLWSGQYITGQQLKDLMTQLNSKGLKYSLKAYEQEGYDGASGTATSGERIDIAKKYKIFSIVFENGIEKGNTIVFSYYANTPVTTETKDYTNEAKVNDYVVQAPAHCSPSTPSIDKSDYRGVGDTTYYDYDKYDGVMQWLVEVKIPEGYTAGNGDLVVKELLPDGVEPNWIEIRAEKAGGVENIVEKGGTFHDGATISHIYGNKDAYTIKATRSGQTITVTIPAALAEAAKGHSINLVFGAKITDAYKDWVDTSGDGVVKVGTFENNVYLYYASNTNNYIATDKQTQVITKEENKGVLTKTGEKVGNDQIIKYTLTINPEGADLLEGTDELVLTDVLSFYSKDDSGNYVTNVELVTGSVKVYERNRDGTRGAQLPVTACPYTYEEKDNGYGNETRTIQMKIPDGRALIVEYEYVYTCPKTWWSIKIDNTARIEGVAISKVNDGTHIEAEVEQSSANATLDGITICKVDAANNAIVLNGAEFKLAEWTKKEDETYAYVPIMEGEDERIYTTNANGQITLEKLKHNTAYCLTEVKPPEGYKASKEPYYFYIFDSDKNTNPECMPTNHDYEIEMLNGGRTVYYPNESEYTSITVMKKWMKDGEDVTSTQDGSIQFELHQVETPKATVPVGGDATFSVSIDREGSCAKTGWYTLSEVSYPSGTTVTFTITDRYGDKTAPNVYLNNTEQSYSDLKLDDANKFKPDWAERYYTPTIYTYTITLGLGQNVITGKVIGGNEDSDWVVSGPTYVIPDVTPSPGEEPSGPTDTVYKNYTVSATDGWTLTVPNLPKESTSGNVYTYYIKEVGAGDTTTYLNNDGITYGAITVTNTVGGTTPTPPTYVLPETGGPGETPYAILGSGLTLTAGGLLVRKKRKKGLT